ncbi:MAG: leucine-rich repeat protein [Clostridia bacterium]|nr:leucine-rich repeat protein [Clostridia bacterium]
MKKKLLILPILFILCALFTLSCNESSDTEDPENYPKASEGLQFKINETEGTCTLMGLGECTDADVIVPQEYKGYKVTSIRENAFYNNRTVMSMIIPESITEIEQFAFYGVSLQYNEYENGLYLGSASNPNYALMYDKDETKADFKLHPETRMIVTQAFYNFKQNIDLIIPKKVERIADEAFYHSSFKSISVEKNSKFFYAEDNCLIEKATQTLVLGLNDGKIPKKVEHIGAMAYLNRWDLKAVELPEGLKSIGENAFQECRHLKTVKLPDSVISIGDSAFSNCHDLEELTVGSGLKTIGSHAFYKCKMSELILPESMTEIGPSAFSYCASLKEIVIPNGVTVLEEWLFNGCSALTSVSIPDSVTRIEDYVFSGCTKLMKVRMSENITEITDAEVFKDISPAAYNTYMFESYLGNENNPYVMLVKFDGTTVNSVIHEDTKVIGPNAFAECRMSTVEIPEGVRVLSKNAFAGYMSKEISLPSTVTYIGDGAFSGCYALESLEIPEKAVTIGKDFLNGCDKLVRLTVAEGNEKYYASGNCIIEKESKTLIAGCNGSVIPTDEGIKIIGRNAFYGRGITKLTIPDTVEIIGWGAFEKCRLISEVVIPSSVKEIQSYSFADCIALEKIVIPGTVTKLGDSVFSKCISLKEAEIGEGVVTTGDSMFSGCNKLENVILPSTLKTLEERTFSGCSSLKEIKLPDSLEKIDMGAFSGCTSLEKIVFPSSLNVVDGFSGCTSLKEVEFFGNIKSIATFAFENCSSLEKVTFHEGVESIGRAFNNCTSIKSITLPTTLTYIYCHAFEGCDGLEYTELGGVKYLGSADNPYFAAMKVDETAEKIELHEDTVIIAEAAFWNKTALTEVTLYGGIKSTEYSFAGCENLKKINLPKEMDSLSDLDLDGCKSIESITVPNGITYIRGWAFEECLSLTTVELPKSIERIGQYAFRQCEKFETIKYAGTVAEWNAIHKTSNWDYSVGEYTVICSDGEIKVK